MEDDFPAESYCDDDDMDEMNGDENDLANDDDNGKGIDWIELSGCQKITRWKFPVFLSKCPVLTCSSDFECRTDVIRHYKENHAADAILCYLCEWPILGSDFQMHFRLIHPNEVNPFSFDDNSSKSEQTEMTQAHTEKV